MSRFEFTTQLYTEMIGDARVKPTARHRNNAVYNMDRLTARHFPDYITSRTNYFRYLKIY